MKSRTPCHRSVWIVLLALAVMAPRAVAKEAKGEVGRFGGMRMASVNGHKGYYAQFQSGKGVVQVLVPDTGGVGDSVKALNPGDVVRFETEKSNNNYGQATLKWVEAVEMKPGEELPRGYVYLNSYDNRDTGLPVVKLSKFGDTYEVVIPGKKGAGGKMEGDSDLQAAVTKLKEGDVVLADVGAGRKLQSIYPYKAPETGKLVKVTDEEVNGAKVPALQIEQDGKPVTVLVPGKLANKKWVADKGVLAETRLVHAGQEVKYMTYADGDKTWLSDIQKAPPAPKPQKEKPERTPTMKKK